MEVVLIAALALAACSKNMETAVVNAQIIVTASGYEFRGTKHADIRQLKLAVDAEPHRELSLRINEEQGCVDVNRISEVVELLRARDPHSVAFIGRTSTNDCKR